MDSTHAPDGTPLIGPNAVLQTAWAMERHIGAQAARNVLEVAGIAALPTGDAMIAEVHALRLHHALAALYPALVETIALEAGQGTADYIIAHRIPPLAVWAMQHLPAPLAARLLVRAIRSHAWTFIGAGAFSVTGPYIFTIDRTSARDAIAPPPTLFLWYAAVFARLYSSLVLARSGCTGSALDPRYPLRYVYRIAPVRAGAAPAQVSQPAQAETRPDPAPVSAAPLQPVSSEPPANRAAS